MSVAFKEWQVVCDALASGRQSILLRKGGIHEGRDGFSFAHESFLLFPTRFHAKPEQMREGDFAADKEWQPGDTFSITHHAKALFAIALTDWEAVEKLHPFHVCTDETLRDRFEWGCCTDCFFRCLCWRKSPKSQGTPTLHGHKK